MPDPEASDFPSSQPTFQAIAAAGATQAVSQGLLAERKKQAEDSLSFDDPTFASEPEETPAPGAAPEKPVKPAAKEKASDFSPGLIARAASYGLDRAALETFGSAAAAEAAISLADRQAMQRQPVAPQVEKPTEEPGFEVLELPELPDGQDWDPAFKATWDAQQQQIAQLAQQNQELRKNMDSNQQALTQREQAAENRVVNGFFNSLEGDVAAKFGKGTEKTLHPSSPQFQERKAVCVLADGLQKQLNLSTEEALDRAMRAMHPEYEPPAERTGKALQEAQGRLASKPTARKPGERQSLDTDQPPEDPEARTTWARQRFAKKWQGAFRDN